MLAKLHRVPIIITRHHSDAVHTIPGYLKRSFYLQLEKRIYRSAAHIIAPAQAVFEVLTERENVPPSKISIIPYGQTTQRFDSVTPDDVSTTSQSLEMDKTLSLVCVSRLHHEKGHRYLFEAFANLVRGGLDSHLYLVGQGAEKDSLQALARTLHVENRIHFLGWRDDALQIIAAADVIVHPTLHEALPSAVIEAIMLGRPTVATDVSGIRDILGDSDYGVVVPPADVEALTKAMSRVAGDLAAAREKANRGTRYLLQYMDARRVATEHTTCYQTIAGCTGELRAGFQTVSI
jgi:glycosyltransferase involved in cell wall biosynthesis